MYSLTIAVILFSRISGRCICNDVNNYHSLDPSKVDAPGQFASLYVARTEGESAFVKSPISL